MESEPNWGFGAHQIVLCCAVLDLAWSSVSSRVKNGTSWLCKELVIRKGPGMHSSDIGISYGVHGAAAFPQDRVSINGFSWALVRLSCMDFCRIVE
jgi:hypothetical protein